jgi:hypothetical protein
MVMRLGGTAKALAREIDIQVLAQGAVQDIGDGQGAVQHTGVTLLLYALARKFSPLDFETTVKAVAEFMSFRRIHGDSIDAALARWDI